MNLLPALLGATAFGVLFFYETGTKNGAKKPVPTTNPPKPAPYVPPLDASITILSRTIDARVDATHVPGTLPCPQNPGPPSGWTYWSGPTDASERNLAVHMLHDPATYPMGSFVEATHGGEPLGARVEWHTLQAATGRAGCFRAVNLMRKEANA